MFKQRLITALILIPIVLGMIYFANKWILSIAILLLFVSIGWEWLSLIVIKGLTNKILAMLMLLVIFLVSLQFLEVYILPVNFLVWGLIILAILTYPKTKNYWDNSYIVGVLSTFVLITFLSSLYVFLLEDGSSDDLVYLLMLVWAMDIGAYLVGKKWGKHKLIPNVSPGKTIEGTFGGLFFVMLVAFGGFYYFDEQSILSWFLTALFIAFIAVFGDLFISMLKRRCNVKDTGQILPGHGGVLDRLDSLIAVLPFYYFLRIMLLDV